MEQLFLEVEFFATGFGVIMIYVIAAVIVLFWDWRVSLLALTIVQLGVATIVANIYQLPVLWPTIQTLVIVLCSLILAISAQQSRAYRLPTRPATWFFRLSALLLVSLAWQIVDLEFALPRVDPQTTKLLMWLGLCSLMILSLSDAPFHTGTALLLWCIPVQAVTAILLATPSLLAMIGILQLAIALASSYLMLLDGARTTEDLSVLTDNTFPIGGLLTGPQWSESQLAVRRNLTVSLLADSQHVANPAQSAERVTKQSVRASIATDSERF